MKLLTIIRFFYLHPNSLKVVYESVDFILKSIKYSKLEKERRREKMNKEAHEIYEALIKIK